MVCLLICLLGLSAQAQTGTVKAHQKISDTEGGFQGLLEDSDNFGRSIALLGDLNGDGNADIAVGAHCDDDGGTDRGAVWILFLDSDGTVLSHQKISDTNGNFMGFLDDGDLFGKSVAAVGDLNGDNITDIAVGAQHDDDGGANNGAVWILFLDSDGTVKTHQKISDTNGNFLGELSDNCNFGCAVASIGDINGDEIADIAVSAPWDDDGGADRGAVWILLLDYDGTVKNEQKISDTQGGFTGDLDNSDFFGYNITSPGDMNGDGISDIAVGAHGDDDGGAERGAVWVLFLDSDGTVKSHQKISNTQGDFTGELHDMDCFGVSLASLDDLDGDGVTDMVVGARTDDDGGTDRGAVWVLFLNSDGTVKTHQKISSTQGNFTGVLDDEDIFGSSIASLGDLNGDGTEDIAVGAHWDDNGGDGRGALWVLFLKSCIYKLPGDMNDDCRFDLSDIAMMATCWLIDCNLTPDDPACVPK